MRFTNAQYLEKEVITVSCRNNNATLAILDGQPVFYQNLGFAVNFGTDVSLSSDTSWRGYGFFAGIAKWSKLAGTASTITGAQVGDVFEAVCYGFTDAIVVRRSRAATTDSWGTAASVNGGRQLAFNIDGYFQVATVTPGNGDGQFFAYLAEDIASLAGTDSGTANMVGLNWTQRMKVFVRTM